MSWIASASTAISAVIVQPAVLSGPEAMLLPMEGFAAARVAALPLDEVGKVLPMSGDRWLVHRRSMARAMAVVELLDGRGQQLASFPHQPWGMGDRDSGCCAFSPCGRYLWATVPTWQPAASGPAAA